MGPMEIRRSARALLSEGVENTMCDVKKFIPIPISCEQCKSTFPETYALCPKIHPEFKGIPKKWRVE